MTYEEIKAHAEAGGWFTNTVINRFTGRVVTFQIETETLTPEFFYMTIHPKSEGYKAYIITDNLKKYNP